ncbi:MAG: GNAT family N-acetyltransferase [Clostridia bacterium]|nr:GNAT family N-acetyltransferase [Clostridia bacterium]
MNLYLRQLSVDDGKDVYAMLKDIEEVENSFTNPVKQMSYAQYREWLIQQDNWHRGVNLPDGYSAQTIYWLMMDEIPVGIGKIRHRLTESSRINGGNIGYAIATAYRCRGLGTELLRLLLKKAKQISCSEILLTVDKNNFASRSVIEKNGGRFIKEDDQRWFFSVY